MKMVEVIKAEGIPNLGDYDIDIYNAIIIPKGATNYDILKAVFGNVSAFRIKDKMEFEKGFELWFSKPYV